MWTDTFMLSPRIIDYFDYFSGSYTAYIRMIQTGEVPKSL